MIPDVWYLFIAWIDGIKAPTKPVTTLGAIPNKVHKMESNNVANAMCDNLILVY